MSRCEFGAYRSADHDRGMAGAHSRVHRGTRRRNPLSRRTRRRDRCAAAGVGRGKHVGTRLNAQRIVVGAGHARDPRFI